MTTTHTPPTTVVTPGRSSSLRHASRTLATRLRAIVDNLYAALMRPSVIANTTLVISDSATDSEILEYPNRRLARIIGETLITGIFVLWMASMLPTALTELSAPYLDASALSTELQQWTRGLIALVGFAVVVYLGVRVFTGIAQRALRPVTRRVYCPVALQDDLRRSVHNAHHIRSYPESVDIADQLQHVVDELGRVRQSGTELVMLHTARNRLAEIDDQCQALTTTPNTLLDSPAGVTGNVTGNMTMTMASPVRRPGNAAGGLS